MIEKDSREGCLPVLAIHNFDTSPQQKRNMRRRRKRLLQRRRDRGSCRTPAAPSNGRAAGSDEEDEEGEASVEAPVTILEQIDLVPLKKTTSNRWDRKMSPGIIHIKNGVNVRSSSASNKQNKLSEGTTDGCNQKQAAQERSNSSNLTPSTSSRPTSRASSRSLKLPTLPGSMHSCHLKAKPCRKSFHNTTHNTTTKNQSSGLKKELKTSMTSTQGSQGQAASSKPPTSKPKVVPILVAITPDNVEHEKLRFFSSDYNYSPQFTYRFPPSVSALQRYSRATDRLIKPAIKIFRATLQRFKTYKQFEAATGGRSISGSQFTAMFQQYLSQEGLTSKVALNLSDSLVARALMTRTNGRPTLNARPNALRAQWSDGLLRHEIGTHYIRSANNREHPWSSAKGRRHHRLGPVNPTEEGIASLHSVLLRKEPFLWRSAMLYYTTYVASRMSFADLFRDLGTYIEDPEVRWDYCLRAKRGQTDTSKPGCFNKDQVYLEGALCMLRYRHLIDFHSLYKLGKVALEDVQRLKTLVDLDSPSLKIPTFMADISEYRKRLDYIVTKNSLDDEELAVLFPGETPCAKSVAVTRPVSHGDCSDIQEAGNCSEGEEPVE